MSDPICYVVRGTDEENDPIEESYPILDLATEAWGAYYSAHAERVEIIAVAEDGTETPLPSYEGALRERDALAATVERLIREAGDIRNDERQRAKAEHDGALDSAHQHALNRAEQLERDNARLRRIIDDADRVKDENETLRRDLASTRAELKALHDVLSGAKKVST